MDNIQAAEQEHTEIKERERLRSQERILEISSKRRTASSLKKMLKEQQQHSRRTSGALAAERVQEPGREDLKSTESGFQNRGAPPPHAGPGGRPVGAGALRFADRPPWVVTGIHLM